MKNLNAGTAAQKHSNSGLAEVKCHRGRELGQAPKRETVRIAVGGVGNGERGAESSG